MVDQGVTLLEQNIREEVKGQSGTLGLSNLFF